jgi:hypothetical protein
MTRIEEVAAALRRSEERLASATWPSEEALERAVGDNFMAMTRGLSEAEMAQLETLNLLDSLEALERRLAALEQTVGGSFDIDAGAGLPMRWAGFWDASTGYVPGQVVGFKDSLWICVRGQTAVRPAGPDSGWRLVVKAPPDRRPAKARR